MADEKCTCATFGGCEMYNLGGRTNAARWLPRRGFEDLDNNNVIPFQAGIRSLQEGQTHYTSNSGILELRQALSSHLERLYGIRYDAENELLISVCVSEALYLALTAVIDPGDEVIVPEPCFVSYTPEVTLAGGRPVTIATHVEHSFQVTGVAV